MAKKVSPKGSSRPPKQEGTVVNPSTGPRTTAGKRRMRYNALKEGVFSSKLVVSEQDKETFAVLESELWTQLKPDTVILELAFQRVLTAAWRYRQAIAMESRRLGEKTGESVPAGMLAFYRGRPQDLNAAAKVLAELSDDVRTNGGIHLDQKKEAIRKMFGEDFYNSIASWAPNPKATQGVLLAETLAHHERKFPTGSPPADIGVRILEDRARWDMSVKLIDQELRHLHDLRAHLDHPDKSPLQEAGLDTFNRYITSTARELERALDWYGYVRTQGMFEVR